MNAESFANWNMHGSALIWLSWARIRNRYVDPDPKASKCNKINK
jgi:hypothetical protein